MPGLKKIVTLHKNDDLRKDQTTFGIIDAQSVQNADTAEEKGYDAGKKTSGIKRHMIVYIMGLPHAVIVTTANVTDRNGAIKMIGEQLDNLSNVKKFLLMPAILAKNSQLLSKNFLRLRLKL